MYDTEYFPEPVAFNFGGDLVKIPGLDGSGKMGKSEGEGNAIFLIDTPEVIRKKVMRAVTDAGPTEPGQPKSEPIQNLFTLMEVVSSSDTLAFFQGEYDKCSIRYGDMKKQLAEDIIHFTTPFRERITEISADEEYLHKVAVTGMEKARASASNTVQDVRKIIGFKSF
jgi:tryptophanyl-tRNA synthetase